MAHLNTQYIVTETRKNGEATVFASGRKYDTGCMVARPDLMEAITFKLDGSKLGTSEQRNATVTVYAVAQALTRAGVGEFAVEWWVDNELNELYIDLSQRFEDRDEAIAEMDCLDELATYDTAGGTDIAAAA